MMNSHESLWRMGLLGPCLLLLFINIRISRSHDLGSQRFDYRALQEKDGSIQAQLSHLRTQLGAVVERVVSVDHRLNALDHRITALDHRVNSLDQRLSPTGEGIGMKSPSDMAGKWKEAQNDESYDVSHGSYEEKINEVEQLKLLEGEKIPFRVRRVIKEDTGHVYIVRLEYQSSTVPDILMKIASYPVEVKHQDLGAVTVYIPKEEHSPDPWVYFVFPEYFVSVRLNLTSSSEMNVPLVTLKIPEGNDVTFKSGHDARLNFVFYVDGDVKNVESESADVRFLMKSSENEDTVDRFHLFFSDSEFTNSARNVRLDLINMEGSKGYRTGTVLFNSSIPDAEGVLEVFITLNLNCSVNCLVRQMKMQHHLNVYRGDHEGPFPEGFIGFVRDDYKRDANQIQCDLSPHAKPCAILCEAAGNRVMSVGIEKVGGFGVDPARTRHLTAGRGGYWGAAMMTFQSLGVEDSGDYLCTARSEKQVIRQKVTLDVQQWG